MARNILAGALAGVLLAGCGATIPTGYRPPESTTPATSVTTFDLAQRQSPVEISGTTLTGKEFSSTELDGIVVVMPGHLGARLVEKNGLFLSS